jgi:hypothetical protein
MAKHPLTEPDEHRAMRIVAIATHDRDAVTGRLWNAPPKKQNGSISWDSPEFRALLSREKAGSRRSGMIIFNYAGIAIAAIALAVGYGAGRLLGFSAEGPMMVVAGPITTALDLVYRLTKADGHWFVPHRGGSLFFLPVWCFGVLWFVLGLVYTFAR